MNDSLMSSFMSLSESLVTLTPSAGELGLLILYMYYLLMLLRDKGSAEVSLQISGLLQEIEESVMEASLKERMVAELRELVTMLQHGRVHQYRERLECFLAVLSGYLQQGRFGKNSGSGLR